MSPCPRCHGVMLPTEDGDLRCLLCGELRYGAASAWSTIFDRLTECRRARFAARASARATARSRPKAPPKAPPKVPPVAPVLAAPSAPGRAA